VNKRFTLSVARPSGQALPEFAQVATVFFLIVFAIMEMGVVVYRYTTISMAAREATRYASVHSTTSQNPATIAQIQAVATNFAPFLTAADVVVSFPADTTPHISDQNDALVTITYNYTQQIPFMSPITLTLTSSSQMLVSQ
jgi:Flp pilus assembly protein TadG